MANSGITWGKPLVEFGLTGAEDACLLYTSDAADE